MEIEHIEEQTDGSAIVTFGDMSEEENKVLLEYGFWIILILAAYNLTKEDLLKILQKEMPSPAEPESDDPTGYEYYGAPV
jgi:hypothetical protein